MAQSAWGVGSPDTVEVYARSGWDPKEGYEQERRFRGAPLDILLLGNVFIADGWQVETHTDNSPWSTCIVRTPQNESDEFWDRWEFNIDFKQQDLFCNVAVVNYLINVGGLFDDEVLDLKAKLAAYLQSSTGNADVVTALTTLYGDADAGAAAGMVYQLMQMGQEYMEVSQPVISRKRTYAYNFAGTLMSTRVTQDIFTTGALVAAFGIPTGVAAQIVADPVSPPIVNYAYGWKMRKNNLIMIPAKNKIEEQIDFIWDQWSVLCYNYIST